MRWTKELLDKLVEEIIPPEFRPGKKEGDLWPLITNFDLMSKTSIDKWVNWEGEDAKGVLAITLNWGRVQKRVGSAEWEKAINSYSVWVSEDFSGPALELKFILLHEIGHIDWKINNRITEWPGVSEELYCDFYACDQLSRVYGADVATMLLDLYGSRRGWNKRTEGQQCLM